MADLSQFVASVLGGDSIRVEESFGEGFVRLGVSEAERRQAKHDIRFVEDAVIELLRNARDAGAQNIYVATTRTDDQRVLVMLDDGCGVPEAMQERIFDARVTSKLDTVHTDRWGVHGRGMALFSIRQNAEVAKVLASKTQAGTAVKVVLNAATLPERKDQSTWPFVGTDDEDRRTCVRGPHNIIRTCAEFALELPAGCEVYLGSPAEILATMRWNARSLLEDTSLLFVDTPEELGVVERSALAADAAELTQIAAGLGLDISERTAHRILAGTIKPVRSVRSRLSHQASSAPKPIDLAKDQRGLRLSQSDLSAFSVELERAFEVIGQRYYVQLSDVPRIRVSANQIRVTFDLDKDDEG